jgi:hypothetical protein
MVVLELESAIVFKICLPFSIVLAPSIFGSNVFVALVYKYFLVSKFSKIIAKRRINELNRDLLTSETEFEKSIFKTRIARLSGHIAKIKIGLSNQFEIIEQRQKVENALTTIKSALEEGILPGGGSFYLYLREEVSNWSSLNLVGDEIFASQIIMEGLIRPFQELFNNTNTSPYKISLFEMMVVQSSQNLLHHPRPSREPVLSLLHHLPRIQLSHLMQENVGA